MISLTNPHNGQSCFHFFRLYTLHDSKQFDLRPSIFLNCFKEQIPRSEIMKQEFERVYGFDTLKESQIKKVCTFGDSK